MCSSAAATEYQVGAGQTYATVNDLLLVVTLGDNDIVWVHPGTYPNFWVRTGGGSSQASAVQIRAWDPNNKPIFDAAGANNCAQFEDPESVYGIVGNWFWIEDLEITGAAYRGIYNVSCNIIVTNCYVHDNYNGYMGGWHNARDAERGDAFFEYNEFNRCGGGAFAHPMYMEGYIAEVRYNWIHDSTGGNSYKDRSRDSILEYNYISAGGVGYRAVQFCGFDDNQMASDIDQYATVIGNVLTQNGGGNPWLFIANERTEGGRGKNTGYMTMTNNSCYTENHTGPMIAGDNVAVTTLHNNIFHSTTCDRMFDKIQGQRTYGVVNTSYNNWVRTGIATVPAMVNTVVGTSPGWVNGAWPLGDFHLTAGSQCINAGNNSVPDLPAVEYDHPANWVDRYSDGQIDIGAYEYVGGPAPPVANFSGNPTSGPPPLTVYFTDLSSGSPTSWSWDFGDTGSSGAQHPSHEYTAESLYTVSLTAYNAQGQDTETKVDYIDVSTGPVQSCHVGAIDMANGGTPAYKAAATVTVHDQDCQPLAGVTVDITWTGAAPGTNSGVTNESGQVTFTSGRNKAGGTYTCCVDNLTKAGYPYDSGANHETCDSITLP
jgi:PKD repeat protein